ncbi:hypothetical protein HDU80_006606 [Chytriomyces hyalinus]|nr:hypothetical protein HDU80_006606 [Chytriomyces hyalinus]
MAECCGCLSQQTTNKIGVRTGDALSPKQQVTTAQPHVQGPMLAHTDQRPTTTTTTNIPDSVERKPTKVKENKIAAKQASLAIKLRPSTATVGPNKPKQIEPIGIDDVDFMQVIPEHSQAEMDMDDTLILDEVFGDGEDDPKESLLLVERSPYSELEMLDPIVETVEDSAAFELWTTTSSRVMKDGSLSYESAESTLVQALETLTETSNRKLLISAHSDMVRFYTQHKQPAKAAKHGSSLTNEYKSVYGERHANVSVLLYNTALSWMNAGEFVQAHECLLECCDIISADLLAEKDACRYLESLCENVSRLDSACAREAKRVFLSALESIPVEEKRTARTMWGYEVVESHPQVHPTRLCVMNCLWKVHVQLLDYSSAENVLVSVLAAMEGPSSQVDDASTVEAQWGLARIYVLQGKIEMAKPLLESCSQSVEHERQAIAKYVQACLLMRERKYDAADFLMAECLPKLFNVKNRNVVDTDALNSALVLNAYCNLRFSQRQFAEFIHLTKPLVLLAQAQELAAKDANSCKFIWYLPIGSKLRKVSLSAENAFDYEASKEYIDKNGETRLGITEQVDALLLALAQNQAIKAQLEAAIAAYPVSEDGETFMDILVDCVRHNESENVIALVRYILKDTVELQSEFDQFAAVMLQTQSQLDAYYLDYAETVREFEAAHPVPVFGSNEDGDEAQEDDQEASQSGMEQQQPTATPQCPPPQPPVLATPPVLSHHLQWLVRTIATRPSTAGYSPLHAACANNHVSLMDLLFMPYLDLPKDLDSTLTLDADTPLHWACLNGHLLVVQLLVKAGASVSCKNKDGRSCLGLAEMLRRERIVNWIVANCDVEEDTDVSMAEAVQTNMDLNAAASSSSSSSSAPVNLE